MVSDSIVLLCNPSAKRTVWKSLEVRKQRKSSRALSPLFQISDLTIEESAPEPPLARSFFCRSDCYHFHRTTIYSSYFDPSRKSAAIKSNEKYSIRVEGIHIFFFNCFSSCDSYLFSSSVLQASGGLWKSLLQEYLFFALGLFNTLTLPHWISVV